jgi:predicted transcriptional regulator
VSDTRERIRECVADRPGIHFNELVRTLGLATGQVQYHLRKLGRADAVVSERLYGRTHYYPPDCDPRERGALAVLRRETARDVLVRLVAEGPTAPADLADDLDVARSTLEWHLDHLLEQDLVEKERDAHNRVTLVATRPEETVRLLRRIQPSLPERLVDRFTRLFDGVLSGEGD